MKLFSQYKGLPRQAYYLSVVMLIVEIAICCIFPFLSLLCSRILGFTTVQTGYIVAFTSLGNIDGSLLGGKLSDEWGRRKTFIRLAVVMICAMTAAGLICTRRAVVVLIFLCNAIASSVVPIISAMVIDISPDEKRNESISLVYIFSNIGSASGPVIAGLLFYNHLPWTFFTMAICYSVALAIMLIRTKETYAGNANLDVRGCGPEADSADTPLFSMVTHSRVMLVFVICLFLIFVCYTFISYLLPLQFSDAVGLERGSKLTSAIWTINGLIVIACTPLLMLFIKKHRPLINLVIGCLLYVAGFLIYALPLSPAMALGAVVIWTCGEIFVNTEGTVLLAELSPMTHRGRVVALFQFSRGTGKLMGPVVCSYVLTSAGYSRVWMIAAAICLVVAGVLYRLYRLESVSAQ